MEAGARWIWFTEPLLQASSAKSYGTTRPTNALGTIQIYWALLQKVSAVFFAILFCAAVNWTSGGDTRPEWLSENSDRPSYYRDFWYRAVIPIPDLFPNGLFVEVRLFDDDLQEPWVEM
jgi:hypothetical protein